MALQYGSLLVLCDEGLSASELVRGGLEIAICLSVSLRLSCCRVLSLSVYLLSALQMYALKVADSLQKALATP